MHQALQQWIDLQEAHAEILESEKQQAAFHTPQAIKKLEKERKIQETARQRQAADALHNQLLTNHANRKTMDSPDEIQAPDMQAPPSKRRRTTADVISTALSEAGSQHNAMMDRILESISVGSSAGSLAVHDFEDRLQTLAESQERMQRELQHQIQV